MRLMRESPLFHSLEFRNVSTKSPDALVRSPGERLPRGPRMPPPGVPSAQRGRPSPPAEGMILNIRNANIRSNVPHSGIG